MRLLYNTYKELEYMLDVKDRVELARNYGGYPRFQRCNTDEDIRNIIIALNKIENDKLGYIFKNIKYFTI